MKEKPAYRLEDFGCVIRALNGCYRKDITFTNDIMRFVRDEGGICPDLFTVRHY